MNLSLDYWPIDRCVDYRRNPRKNDTVIHNMVASITEFGFTIPILVKSDGLVIDGHLRLKAARQLKMEQVPVVIADHLSEVQIKAFRLLANRSANWAEWDDELLKLELDELKTLDFDLALTGFNDDELLGQFNQNDVLIEDTKHNASMSDRFGVPPFSVLNAREGWWQSRKQAWIALGIQSELGRGDEYQSNATPGGSLMPAMNYHHQQRGDGRGRPL